MQIEREVEWRLGLLEYFKIALVDSLSIQIAAEHENTVSYMVIIRFYLLTKCVH